MAFSTHKVLLALVFTVLLGVGIVLYFLTQKDDAFTESTPPERATLSGEYGCLPRAEPMSGDDCVPSLETTEGTYYALDFGLMSRAEPEIKPGDRVTASGVVTPIENLSTDYWQQFDVAGIFSVTDSVAVETGAVPQETATTTITDAEWVWVRTEYATKASIEPQDDSFVLAIRGDGRMGSSTDCNTIGGEAIIDGEVLSFGALVSTKMYCEGSLEGVYAHDLALVSSYAIEADTLRLNLNRDYGTMYFTRQLSR